uniref:Uncharacterized protein n=1 Tax=Chrysotila carterae TaxID=13221 RepID=A0A7S4B605_CHRCT|eukprot:6190689-Pleurochrysis_carterae.AAC.1
MGLLAEAIGVAAQCQAQFVAICGVGAWAASRGLLHGATLKDVSRLYLRVLMPCILLRMHAAFTVQRLLDWSCVVVIGVAHIIIGALLGRVAAFCLRLRPPQEKMLTMSVAFGNCGSLPFVLLLPVCTNWSRTQRDEGALSKGMGIIGLYLVAWYGMFFTFGTRYIEHLLAAPMHAVDGCIPPSCVEKAVVTEPEATNESCANEAPSAKLRSDHETGTRTLTAGRLVSAGHSAFAAVDPLVWYIVLSVAVGCTPFLSDALGAGGLLSWLAHTVDSLGACGVVLGTIILGGSLWQARSSQSDELRPSQQPQSTTSDLRPRSKLLCGRLNAKSCGLSSQHVLVTTACVLRLVLLPAVAMPLNVLATRCGLLPHEPVLQMLVHIFCATPSSQTLVTLLLSRGRHDLAAITSPLYLPMYIFSIFSVASVIVVAVLVIDQMAAADRVVLAGTLAQSNSSIRP